MGKMIFRILFIFIIFMGIGAFAKTKIALIGDSKKTNQIANMVLAKMSDNDNLEFLERSAIEKVLKEHKLQKSGISSKQIPLIAKILHADIFAVLSSAQVNKKTMPSSLRVFDARNGFCLIDTALPTEIEKCADFISNKLKTLPSQKSLKFVSILAVRNAGAPAKYKRQMAHVAMEVERRLIAMPDVAVLERSELGLVNKERKITKKLFKLAPSAYLLDLEFAPTSSADKVDLRIYVLNTSGKKLKSFNFSDCLKTTPQEIIKVLAKYLKTSPPLQVASNKEEAKRFFREYKYHFSQKQYIAAVRSLKAAIALNADNVKYQVTLLSTMPHAVRERRSSSKQKYFSELLHAARQILKESKAIRQCFPNYPKGITEIQVINDWLWYNFKNDYSVLTAKQKQAVINYSHEMRPFLSREFTRYWKYDLSDGINSSGELGNYKINLNRNNWRSLYFDDDEFVQARIINSTKVIKAYNEFSKKHRFVKSSVGFHVDIPRNLYNVLTRHLQKKAILDFIVAAKASQQADIRAEGYAVEFFRKSALKKHERKYFATELKKLLSILVEIYQDKNRPLSKMPNSFLFTFRKYLRHRDAPRGLYDLFEKTRKEFIINNSSPQSWATFDARNKQAKTAEDKAKLVIASKGYIGTWRRTNRKTNRMSYFSGHPAYAIGEIAKAINPFTRRVKDRKLCLEALSILNFPLKVKLVKTVFESKNNFFRNAVEYKGSVYLIAGHATLMIFKFDLKSEKINKVYSVKDNSQHSNFEYGLNAFFVDDKYFAIGSYNKILIISRKNKRVATIKDLPDKFVNAVAVINDRVYAFTGLKKRTANTLFSCDLKGGGRKVHISTRNRVKRNLLEKQSDMFVSGLFPDLAKKRILFTNGMNYSGLWAMNIEDGKLKCLLSINNSFYHSARKIKDKLYISGGPLNSAYFTYDIKKDSYKFICFNYSSNHLKDVGIKTHKPCYITGQRLNIYSPFLTRGKYLWAGGYGQPGFVDMKARNGRHYIYGLGHGMGISHKTLFFPYPDGHSVYAVTRYSIFMITPPKNINNEGGKVK